MKKTMIMMCITAFAALCTPAVAGENITPPVNQEMRIVKTADLLKNENTEPSVNSTETTAPSEEANSESSTSHSGGYFVISGAGLLLLIILLIILL